MDFTTDRTCLLLTVGGTGGREFTTNYQYNRKISKLSFRYNEKCLSAIVIDYASNSNESPALANFDEYELLRLIEMRDDPRRDPRGSHGLDADVMRVLDKIDRLNRGDTKYKEALFTFEEIETLRKFLENTSESNLNMKLVSKQERYVLYTLHGHEVAIDFNAGEYIRKLVIYGLNQNNDSNNRATGIRIIKTTDPIDSVGKLMGLESKVQVSWDFEDAYKVELLGFSGRLGAEMDSLGGIVASNLVKEYIWSAVKYDLENVELKTSIKELMQLDFLKTSSTEVKISKIGSSEGDEFLQTNKPNRFLSSISASSNQVGLINLETIYQLESSEPFVNSIIAKDDNIPKEAPILFSPQEYLKKLIVYLSGTFHEANNYNVTGLKIIKNTDSFRSNGRLLGRATLLFVSYIFEDNSQVKIAGLYGNSNSVIQSLGFLLTGNITRFSYELSHVASASLNWTCQDTLTPNVRSHGKLGVPSFYKPEEKLKVETESEHEWREGNTFETIKNEYIFTSVITPKLNTQHSVSITANLSFFKVPYTADLQMISLREKFTQKTAGYLKADGVCVLKNTFSS